MWRKITPVFYHIEGKQIMEYCLSKKAREIYVKFLVIKPHVSEYPDPIRFKKGSSLVVGEKSDGIEKWDNWYFCSTSEHAGGWVPAQIIALLDDKNGVALEDYSANELNVAIGDILLGEKNLNGWVWCLQPHKGIMGWVPLENLQSITTNIK